jgi:adenylyltransferase/sulfurtransferase
MPDPTLHVDDDDRYARLRLIPWWDQERLRRARVLVVGAGALGNEVLKNLALVGVGHLVVVDQDVVEPANLTRSVLFRARDKGRPKAEVAAESVRDLNPDLCVTAIADNVLTAVGLGTFRDADVVVGCLDNREARLWVNRSCWKVSTPWVDGAIQELSGVVKVFTPPDSPCYECTMTENDYRLINLRYSCPLLRQEDLIAGRVPTVPTIASLIGGLQAQEALKLIHGLPVAGGEAFVFNGVVTQSYRTRFQRREDCLSHGLVFRGSAALEITGSAVIPGSRFGRFAGVPWLRYTRACASTSSIGGYQASLLPAVRRTFATGDRACRDGSVGTCRRAARVARDSAV